MALRLRAVQHDPHLAEVHLRLDTRSMLLRNEDLNPTTSLDVDLGSSNSNIVSDNRIRQLFRPMLLNEAGEDATGSMALIPQCRYVLDQHRVDRSGGDADTRACLTVLRCASRA